MWCLRLNNKLQQHVRIEQTRLVHQALSRHLKELELKEYTSEPEYPEIQDLSYKARKTQEVVNWHETIRSVKTVEEKLIKINQPRYYGHKVVNLSDEKLPYNALPALQYYTRTLFELIDTKVDSSEAETPTTAGTGDSSIDTIIKNIENDIQNSIVYAHMKLQHNADFAQLSATEQDFKLGQLIVEQVNRILTNALSTEYPHLRELETDYQARHEAFWCVGGIDPPKNVVKSKKGREWQKDMQNDPVDRLMQYKGRPYLCLRHQKQLKPWANSENEKTSAEESKKIVQFKFDPRTLGYSTGNEHVKNIPGMWPNKQTGFSFMSFVPRHFLTTRPTSGDTEELKEIIHAQAIQASFGWLSALAGYYGFNTYNDITYPMNTQTVVTNGKIWSFYEYQLNTLLMHSDNINSNPKVNNCRGTLEMDLYQEVSKEGKCIGFNGEVLKHLITYFMKTPSIKRDASEEKPYLDEKYAFAADYSDEQQRTFVDNIFKYISSGRPRHLEEPEYYLWEKIYKIDNKTRALEAKRRFFEVGINPWRRTLDQHQKVYIPRCKRVNGPKDKKNKWEATYYP